MIKIDLTPFGFTPTENVVYLALLEQGPSGGYALAKRLNIARANAYQALNGLVSKEAATVLDERPQRYRAVRQDALFARVVDAQSRRLDLLEEQLGERPEQPGADVIPILGRRSLVDLALRTAARETGPLRCVASIAMARDLSPAWRRRLADGRTSTLWLIQSNQPGSDEAEAGHERSVLPIEAAGTVPAERAARFFDAEAFVLEAGDTVIIARTDGESTTGFWSTASTIVGLARAAAAGLTQ
jgi:sugar-specific transcriptional regulator TrmB